jgi:hypothetical protein
MTANVENPGIFRDMYETPPDAPVLQEIIEVLHGIIQRYPI